MVASTASVGYGVIAAKGLIPIANNTVMGNVSGITDFPVAIPIASLTLDLDVGSSTITGGTTTRVLYDNAGVLGEYTITGTGSVAMSASPAFTGTPTFGSISSVITTALTRPVEPVVTPVGGTGGANWRYVVVAHGAGTTAASAAMVNPVSGSAVLDGSHYNAIQTVAGTGITSYDIYRTQAGGTPSSTGCIAQGVVPGAAFNDTGIVAHTGTATPSADTGSNGTYTTNPFVISSATANTFGLLQVGNQPTVWTAADTPGWASPTAVFTQALGSYQGAIAIGGQEMLFRTPLGSTLNPTSESSGAGLIGGENFVSGIELWKSTAYWEFGGAGGTFDAMSKVRGRHQLAIQDGNAGGMNTTGRGLVIVSQTGYTSTLNTVGVLTTNGADIRQYRVGYQNTRDSDDLTNYERADFSFQGVTNVLTALSWASTGGGQITGTTTTAHGLVVGQGFELTGNTPSLYNGSYVAIAGTTGSTLVASLANNPGVNTVLGSAHYPGTVYYGGPVAGGTGTLRDFVLTGANVRAATPIINTASTIQYLGSGGGTADAITLTPTPAITAYATGAIYFYKSTAANATTTPTIAISGLAATTIVKRAATALAAGDIPNGAMIILMYDGTNMQLLNPIVN